MVSKELLAEDIQIIVHILLKCRWSKSHKSLFKCEDIKILDWVDLLSYNLLRAWWVGDVNTYIKYIQNFVSY